MKKRNFALTFILMIIMSLIFYSCLEDRERVVKTTNAVYLDIKTVVTDPEIKPMIPEKTLDRLAVVEQVYLKAANALQFPEADNTKPNTKPLGAIVYCADEILGIIDSLVLDGRYERQIAAIRLSIKILKNHLPIE